MNKVLTVVKKFLIEVKYQVLPIEDPREAEQLLPQGMAELNTFVDEVIAESGLPLNESTKQALCFMIISMPQAQDMVSKQHFVQLLRKAAANQVASQMIVEVREAEKAKQESAKLKVVENPPEAPSDKEPA